MPAEFYKARYRAVFVGTQSTPTCKTKAILGMTCHLAELLMVFSHPANDGNRAKWALSHAYASNIK